MRPTLVISGYDFSWIINKYSYAVAYEEREGGNGGIAKDGSTILDILAYKAVITVETNGAKAHDLAGLIVMLQGDFVTIEFSDPASGDTRTAEFHAVVGEVKTAMWKRGGIAWQSATKITFTER